MRRIGIKGTAAVGCFASAGQVLRRVEIGQAGFSDFQAAEHAAGRGVNGEDTGMEALIGANGDVFRSAAAIFAVHRHLRGKFGKSARHRGGIDGHAFAVLAVDEGVAVTCQGVAAEIAPGVVAIRLGSGIRREIGFAGSRAAGCLRFVCRGVVIAATAAAGGEE